MKIKFLKLIVLSLLFSAVSCNKESNDLIPDNPNLTDSKETLNKERRNKINQEYIELTTDKKVGETIMLDIISKNKDLNNIWIDLNNNSKQDEGEQIKETKNYTLKSKIFRIFGKVTNLKCPNAGLTKIDFSNNNTMFYLDCSFNKLTKLDVNNNKVLQTLICYKNELVDISMNNTSLITLKCHDNKLTNLDVSNNNPLLRNLDCFTNSLNTLNFSNTKIVNLDCHENKLTELKIKNHPQLKSLHCYENQFKNLDVSNNSKLVSFHCFMCPLEYIKVSQEQLDKIYATKLLWSVGKMEEIYKVN